MKSKVYSILLLFTTFSLITYSQNNDTSSKQKHLVELHYLSVIDAFNSHNVEEFVKQFADDIEVYTNDIWYRGVSSIRKRYTYVFQEFPSITMEISNFNLREIAKKTVVIDYNWKILPNGIGNYPIWSGVGTGVYILRNKKWEEVLIHETLVENNIKPNIPKVEFILKYYAYLLSIHVFIEEINPSG